ncbi:hypothetical protein ACFL6P_05610 [Candidatus Latescibacterota bacterium]
MMRNNLYVTLLVVIIPTILVFSCGSDSPETQLPERNVLLEVFTGTWCGWCPYGADVIKDLKSRYDNLIPIAYHFKDEMEIKDLKELSDVIRPAYPQATIDTLIMLNRNYR